MNLICPADGLDYREHPADPPNSRYDNAREALRLAFAAVIYWPGITDGHRLAVVRARQHRQAVRP